MCGSFEVDAQNPEVKKLAQAWATQGQTLGSGAFFPGESISIIQLKAGSPAFAEMLWGFPGFNGKKLIFNARAETALQKSMFAAALRNHGIAVPVTGFYEWRTSENSRRKERFLFTDESSSVFYLAGCAKFLAHEQKTACVVLTTAANQSVCPYHHRMPVLLRPNEILPWLNGSRLEFFLARIPFAMQACKAFA